LPALGELKKKTDKRGTLYVLWVESIEGAALGWLRIDLSLVAGALATRATERARGC
jgi:hypothetical protein